MTVKELFLALVPILEQGRGEQEILLRVDHGTNAFLGKENVEIYENPLNQTVLMSKED